MRIAKVVNNNLVMILDQDGNDMVLKGKGIGFGKKAGEEVEESRIEKRFVLADNKAAGQFMSISGHLNPDAVDLAADIVEIARNQLKQRLSDMIYVTLSDHISNLLERIRMSVAFDNNLLWDIKRIYKVEYQIGKKGVDLINERENLRLGYDEASFIALHIVNAEMNSDMRDTYRITALINDICDIARGDLNLQFSEDDYYWDRFMMHLKFLFENEPGKIGETASSGVILDDLSEKYQDVRKCIDKISDFIYICIQRRITENEKLYLMIHLVQISTKSDENGKKG